MGQHFATRGVRFSAFLVATAFCGSMSGAVAQTADAVADERAPQHIAPPPETSSEEVGASRGEGDIVVLARRRAERLFDVPVAVSALSERDLSRYSSDSIMKMAELSPGLNIGARTAGGAGAGITIRGVGTDGSNVGIPQSVSISIDGLQVSRGRALWGSYFDLQQVEVMKGPQALFFGKNSPAGVISLTSKGPTPTLEGQASLAYEFRADEVAGDFALSGPLTDTLGFRVAVRARDMAGYIYNDARPFTTSDPAPYDHLPGANGRAGEREFAGRLTLQFDQGPFKATLKMADDLYRDDGAIYPMELVYCGAGFPQNYNSLIFGYPRTDPSNECRANWRTTSGGPPAAVTKTMRYGMEEDGRQYSDVKTSINSLNLSYDFGDHINLVSTTGFYYLRSKNLGNNDWTSYGSTASTEGEDYHQFSQELRLSSSWKTPFNFMVGGFYEKSRVIYDGSIKLDDLPEDPLTGRYYTIDKIGVEHGEAFSVFGQLMYKLTPELELSAGARYTHETKRGYIGVSWVHPMLEAVFPVRNIPAENTSNNLSPEVALTWRPSRNLTLYSAYKTGYKSGGLNLSQIVSASVVPAAASFNKEEARGFEAGVKTHLADGRLALQVTAYRYKFTDLQVSAYVPALRSYIVSNAAASRSTGIEAETTYRASSDFTLRSSVAYNRSRYLNFPNAAPYSNQTTGLNPDGSQNLSGRPTLTAPAIVLTGGFDYSVPVGGSHTVTLSGDGYYSSGYYFTQTQSPHAWQGDFFRLNAALRFASTDSPWELSLIGRNLTNTKVIVSGQDSPLGGASGNPAAINGVLGRPREVRAQVSYRF